MPLLLRAVIQPCQGEITTRSRRVTVQRAVVPRGQVLDRERDCSQGRPRSVRLAVRAHTGVEGYLLSTGFAVRELRCNDPRRRVPSSPGPQEKLSRGWRHAGLGLGGDGPPLFGGWRRTSAGGRFMRCRLGRRVSEGVSSASSRTCADRFGSGPKPERWPCKRSPPA
jgi:hypothetical protein